MLSAPPHTSLCQHTVSEKNSVPSQTRACFGWTIISMRTVQMNGSAEISTRKKDTVMIK